jgi:hypothetical protein
MRDTLRKAGFAQRRAARLFSMRNTGFLTGYDVFTPEEMDRTPIFTEFLRRRGPGWGIATAISVPTGEMIAFEFEATN